MQIKIIIGLLAVLCSNVLHAEYDDTDLKRLFTDKGQRAQIDAVRSGNNPGVGMQQSNKVKVSGYVTRSDGKDVVWVNNKNTLDGPRVGDIKVQQSNIGKNKKVGVTLDGVHVHLKPGETWDKETGKVVENY